MIYYPTNKIRVSVNKKNVLESGLVKEKDSALILDYIDIDLPSSGLYKNQLLMLDILANNDWKRPIYFTGGSYNDSEYLWMKDYLQLDGLVYKLVPIKTEINKNNPYELGRIDADLMYPIVKGWEWGNSDSDDIYHDPETRKNSISFRGNLHRLALQLMKEGKNTKAEEILDLSISKMPIDYFGFYSLLEPYVSSYYKLNSFQKGNNLFNNLAKKYQENLSYYSQISRSKNEKFSIYTYAENIITDTERYRTLVESSLESNDSNLKSKAIKEFINSSDYVKNLYGDYEYYTLMIPFLKELYSSKENNLAKELYLNISNQLNERLGVFISMPEENRINYGQNISNDVYQFSTIITILKNYEKDQDLIKSELNSFLILSEKLNIK
tara:strand:- start:927 stop:2075 length:1149 start_codon:yes stop_codon:yes gene_type:complete